MANQAFKYDDPPPYNPNYGLNPPEYANNPSTNPSWQYGDPNRGYGPPGTSYPPPTQVHPENTMQGGYGVEQTAAAPLANVGNFTITNATVGNQSADVESPMTEFTEISIRKGFIRKVFAILTIQLIVTFGIMSIFVFSEDAKEFIGSSVWSMVAASVTVLVLTIGFACNESFRRKSPANIICLGIYTVAMAWLLSASASTFDADEVLIAVGMCLGVTFIMFCFGLQTKYDFTKWLGPLVSVLFCLFMFGLMALIMQNRIMNLLYACLGAIVFSLFITIDVQMVVGKGRYSYDSEEYILAALNIYLDIVNLLLMIFAIMQNSD